jgi:hypothetical protein
MSLGTQDTLSALIFRNWSRGGALDTGEALAPNSQGDHAISSRMKMCDCSVKNCFRPFNSLIKTDRLQTLLPDGLSAAKKKPSQTGQATA